MARDVSSFTTLMAAATAAVVLFVALTILRRVVGRQDYQNVEEKKMLGSQLTIEPLENFRWESESPKLLRPVKRIYHITMGLKSDTPSELITIDSDYSDRVKLRAQLMAIHEDTVLGFLPEGKEAVREIYNYLFQDYLPIRYPTIFRLNDDKKTLRNIVTSASFSTQAPEDGLIALRRIGQTVEEEMFLLRETPEGHQCVALVCCFASGFDPSTKLGKTLQGIHSPVPAYEKIGPSMERFFSKLEVGKSVKRTNWSIQTIPDLFVCKTHPKPGETVEDVEDVDIEKVYFRVELQTLTRLPKTRAVLFSFKTYMYPMRQLKEEGQGPAMADAIEGLAKGNAAGMWTYKGASVWGDKVVTYLRA